MHHEAQQVTFKMSHSKTAPEQNTGINSKVNTKSIFEHYIFNRINSHLPATRISQARARANSRPPPSARPSIAAIVGTGRLAETG